MFHKNIKDWIRELIKYELVILGEEHDDPWCKLFEAALVSTLSCQQETYLALERYPYGNLEEIDLREEFNKNLYQIVTKNKGFLGGLEVGKREDALYGVSNKDNSVYQKMFSKFPLARTIGLTNYQRNRNLAENLERLCRENPFVIAIVGAGHIDDKYGINFPFQYFFEGQDSFCRFRKINYCGINLLKEENLRF